MNILYSLAEMKGIIGGRAVALIGSGESRLRYLFNPKTVCAIAINKSGIDYPAELACVVEDHISEVFYLGIRQPIVFVPTLEVMKYNVFNSSGYWTATILAKYLCIEVRPSIIYMQGFDLSLTKYLPQAEHFLEISQTFPQQKIFFTKNNSIMPFFPTINPERSHIL